MKFQRLDGAQRQFRCIFEYHLLVGAGPYRGMEREPTLFGPEVEGHLAFLDIALKGCAVKVFPSLVPRVRLDHDIVGPKSQARQISPINESVRRSLFGLCGEGHT